MKSQDPWYDFYLLQVFFYVLHACNISWIHLKVSLEVDFLSRPDQDTNYSHLILFRHDMKYIDRVAIEFWKIMLKLPHRYSLLKSLWLFIFLFCTSIFKASFFVAGPHADFWQPSALFKGKHSVVYEGWCFRKENLLIPWPFDIYRSADISKFSDQNLMWLMER